MPPAGHHADPDPGSHSILEQISTRWNSVNDPLQFVMRYAPAIRNYLGALIPNQHDADEATQEFLLRAVQRGFRHASPDRGRFRDYLKAAVRNAAFKHLRRRRNAISIDAVPDPAAEVADRIWLRDWHNCILTRAWRSLDRHEREHPGGLAHTVLKIAADYAEEDSAAQAARVSASCGRPVRADAFRKQLSRARRLFAGFLVEAVRETLEEPTPERVQEELGELGLLRYVRDMAPNKG
jgi:DNA-directed RNA polymerase specialized sigma24 family protein